MKKQYKRLKIYVKGRIFPIAVCDIHYDEVASTMNKLIADLSNPNKQIVDIGPIVFARSSFDYYKFK